MIRTPDGEYPKSRFLAARNDGGDGRDEPSLQFGNFEDCLVLLLIILSSIRVLSEMMEENIW